MTPCIVVKKVQFRHQFVYTGNEDERHCHFCGLTFANCQKLDEALKQEEVEDKLWEGIGMNLTWAPK